MIIYLDSVISRGDGSNIANESLGFLTEAVQNLANNYAPAP